MKTKDENPTLTEAMSSSMLADANELVAMLVSAIKKVR